MISVAKPSAGGRSSLRGRFPVYRVWQLDFYQLDKETLDLIRYCVTV